MKFISFKTLRSMCIDLIIFLVPLSLIIVAIPYVFKLLMPFIIGFFLYLAARPLNKLLSRRLPRTLSAILSLAIISLTVFFLFQALTSKIFSEIRSFTENPPSAYTSVLTDISDHISFLTKRVSLNEFLSSHSIISNLMQALREQLSRILSSAGTFLLSAAKNIPAILIAAFAAVFTTFFLLKEDSAVFSFFRRFFGEKVYNSFLTIKTSLFNVAASYIKAQLIIESIVFLILLTGFSLLGINYSFLLAILTALVDVVPIFGTGTVLIPLSVFNFLSANTSLGWGLLVLYGITLLARQLCEPKIIGKSLGIHPLATVFSLYVGMKLFGIFGLVFGPMAAIFIKSLIFPE